MATVRLKQAAGGVLAAMFQEFGLHHSAIPGMMGTLLDGMELHFGRQWDGVFPVMVVPLIVWPEPGEAVPVRPAKNRQGLIVAWGNVFLMAKEVRWGRFAYYMGDNVQTRTQRTTMALKDGEPAALILTSPGEPAIAITPDVPGATFEQRRILVESLETVLAMPTQTSPDAAETPGPAAGDGGALA